MTIDLDENGRVARIDPTHASGALEGAALVQPDPDASPSKMSTFEFHVGKHRPTEQWEREGKPEWPDHVRLELPRHRVWDLAMQILRSLQIDDDGCTDVSLALLGDLRETEDE